MQREISTTKPNAVIKSPKYPVTRGEEFGAAIAKMVDAMYKQLENQVLKELNKGTVEKFEDAQVGNYAAIFMRLSKRARRKLLRRFDDGRIEKFTRGILSRSDTAASRQLYGRVEKEIGISTTDLLKTEALNPQLNALVQESSEWVKGLRDSILEEFTTTTLRLMTHGTEFEEILNQHRAGESKRKNHAQFIARNQLANFNSISTKIRAQNLGITEAIWVTAGGPSRLGNPVRKCHKVRNGKKFDLAKGLFSSCDGKWLLPGIDYNCRCTYELIIPTSKG